MQAVAQNLATANDVTVTKFLDSSIASFLDQVQDDISVTKFLAEGENDISVTKFLNQAEDEIALAKNLASNDITVTKFLEEIQSDLGAAKFLAQQNGDTAVSKYLQQAMDDIAVTKYLETVLSKFLEAEDNGDISVSKFLDQRSNDVTVTKFLNQRSNDVTVTKFLDEQNEVPLTKFLSENDISVTKFLDNVVSKFLSSNDITVTKFLAAEDGIAVTKYLASNDITVTKFLDEVLPAYHLEHGSDLSAYLDTTVTKFLESNDVSVTKFLYQRSNDVTVTKFLNSSSSSSNDITVTKFLDAAMNQYLDTTVTKFLENDISVTKFLAQANNDITVTKFLDEAVAHFLESNDITVTKFLEENDISVTKFLQNDVSVTKFLGTASTRFLESNDITVTKFLDVTVTKFLSESTAVTSFLEQNDVSVTKFLGMAITNFLLDSQAVDAFLGQNNTAQNEFVDVKFALEDDPNEISITKFLSQSAEDGISVTKFLNADNEFVDVKFALEDDETLAALANEISITKFLQDASCEFNSDFCRAPANDIDCEVNSDMCLAPLANGVTGGDDWSVVTDNDGDDQVVMANELADNGGKKKKKKKTKPAAKAADAPAGPKPETPDPQELIVRFLDNEPDNAYLYQHTAVVHPGVDVDVHHDPLKYKDPTKSYQYYVQDRHPHLAHEFKDYEDDPLFPADDQKVYRDQQRRAESRQPLFYRRAENEATDDSENQLYAVGHTAVVHPGFDVDVHHDPLKYKDPTKSYQYYVQDRHPHLAHEFKDYEDDPLFPADDQKVYRDQQRRALGHGPKYYKKAENDDDNKAEAENPVYAVGHTAVVHPGIDVDVHHDPIKYQDPTKSYQYYVQDRHPHLAHEFFDYEHEGVSLPADDQKIFRDQQRRALGHGPKYYKKAENEGDNEAEAENPVYAVGHTAVVHPGITTDVHHDPLEYKDPSKSYQYYVQDRHPHLAHEFFDYEHEGVSLPADDQKIYRDQQRRALGQKTEYVARNSYYSHEDGQ